MKASRYPMASFTMALNELSIEAKIARFMLENGVQEEEIPDFSNVVKLEQSRQMLKASIEDIQKATKADAAICNDIEACLVELHQ